MGIPCGAACAVLCPPKNPAAAEQIAKTTNGAAATEREPGRRSPDWAFSGLVERSCDVFMALAHTQRRSLQHLVRCVAGLRFGDRRQG